MNQVNQKASNNSPLATNINITIDTRISNRTVSTPKEKMDKANFVAAHLDMSKLEVLVSKAEMK